MKSILLCSCLLILTFQCYAQYDADKMFYLQKSEKYRKMKSTGTVLAVGGGILAVVGFVTLLNSTITETNYGGGQTQTTTTGHPVLGAASFLVGLGGLGSGIPLWIIGAHNERKYMHKLENTVSFRFNVNPQRTGIALTYHF
jgi:hypothetical protein